MLKKVIREKDKEKLDMNVFKELGKDLNYKDILQVDGAFSACHINYGKSLKFNGADSKNSLNDRLLHQEVCYLLS